MKISKLFCEDCKEELQRLEEDDFGTPIDWNTPWEQYLCQPCLSKIWRELQDQWCAECRTRPCEKGRDCWGNPWPHIMYLCYVAPRKSALTEIMDSAQKTIEAYS